MRWAWLLCCWLGCAWGMDEAQPPWSSHDAARLYAASQPVTGSDADYDALLARIGDASLVLLGEATHGSREFYQQRARISRRLIEEKGFRAIVIEADDPLLQATRDYILGNGRAASAEQALAHFRRFPSWLWRNDEMAAFVEQLRDLNQQRPATQQVGLYGMDLYAVPEATERLAALPETSTPRLTQLTACFLPYRAEPQFYGLAVRDGRQTACDVTAQQVHDETNRQPSSAPPLAPGSALIGDRLAALTVRNGEAYYRLLYTSGESSWNLRDTHMADSIDLLRQLLAPPEQPAKLIVWAHNSHVGDARGTQQSAVGELSLGQLLRQRHGAGAVVLVGLGTASGTVRAASQWGGRDRVKLLQPPHPGSYSALFARHGQPSRLLIFDPAAAWAELLQAPRPERFIGVNYLPDDEWRNHYMTVRLGKQFDAWLHLSPTHALPAPPATGKKRR